jgi:hypothetical protein
VAAAGGLGRDLEERRREGEVSWEFQVQGFLDRERTPLDDHRVAWRSPWLTVARLTLAGDEVVGEGDTAIGFRVTPDWPDERGAVFEPLGDLNALRAAAYAESAGEREPGAGIAASH